MFKSLIEADLKKAVVNLGFVSPADSVLYIPENSGFGDYSTNISLQLSKQKHKNSYQSPHDIASAILKEFGHPKYLERIEIAGAGFINFFIRSEDLIKVLIPEEPKKEEGIPYKYLVEFAHPNTHKAFHIGHLRNISIGESISRLLEYNGSEVFRVTYGGDIGPHVAKALWGILNSKDEFEEVRQRTLREKAEFLGKAYAKGSAAYLDPQRKIEIDEINTKLYQKDLSLMPLWQETKKWSIGYFDSIYSRVGTVFDAQIWESEVQEEGVKAVKDNIGKIFKEDQGAIIFPGEKYGLHNRVFITGKGYPTYEAKELGLNLKEEELYSFDKSLHIVASEQAGFFDVVIKASEMIDASRKDKKKHVSYGMVNLSTGKMSSRKGDIVTAESLIDEVMDRVKNNFAKSALNILDLQKIAIGAIKFNFLKYSFTSDIAYDIEKSISLQGDSAPYVMYVFARIKSIINKVSPDNRANESEAEEIDTPAQKPKIAQSAKQSFKQIELEPEEREILRYLEHFEAVTDKSAKDLAPNEITKYLLDLAKAFNSFYENHPVLGTEKQGFRLEMIKNVAESIFIGLYLLGIETVDRM